jgi:hypothetical protein
MKIAKKYSHINGEEYLIVHHKNEYKEIQTIIKNIDANKFFTTDALKQEFKKHLYSKGWGKRRRDFYVSTEPDIVRQLEPLEYDKQKELLLKINHPLLSSYNQTDFIKNKIAVEVQLGKYFAVTYDLFVKHLSFFTGRIINIGIEIVPTKKMQKDMSSGPPWFEKEVHNVLRHGRTNPPVPLLLLGIEP